jgi:hypothetical protein
MNNPMKGKKINNIALEVIMRDVLHGMADFTRDNSCGSQLGSLEIVAVESPDEQQATARILPFPAARKTSVKK